MGLDQYAYFVRKQDAVDDFTINNFNDYSDDYYWRKNRHLQGWMKNLYYTKGGKAEDFNCELVQLTKEDLEELEKVINSRSFDDVHGYFWGNFEYSDDDAKYDLEFVRDAKDWIASGGAVYYYSWW